MMIIPDQLHSVAFSKLPNHWYQVYQNNHPLKFSNIPWYNYNPFSVTGENILTSDL